MKIFSKSELLCTVCVVLLLLAQRGRSAELRVQQATSKLGMVVSDSPLASRVGRDVLKKGGNAVDAAIATAFALAVTLPEAGNIGGGGFMMVHSPGGNPICVDYREMAPGTATKDMFSSKDGRYTHKIVGVPGTVRGLALAHEKCGTLPWKDLVDPAVQLANDGFVVDPFLARSINGVISRLGDQVAPRHEELLRVYGHPDGRPWKAGERLVLKDLAKSLRAIAAEGPKAFYHGAIADQLVAEMKRGDGRISKDDLAKYRARIREPIHGTFRGYDIYGPPPPSSGGICLVQMLSVLENFSLAEYGHLSANSVHLITETMRRTYFDRARYLGDQDFVTIPAHLTSKEYAKKLARQIDLDTATPSASIATDIPIADESPSTTHFSVVDAKGMAVSNTYTLEASWGSRIVVRGAGFVLNNEMGDFNWLPGTTTRTGQIGTKPNLIEPHKRMLSSQTPTIVARDGRVALVTGSPGGRTIINTVLGIVLNVIEFKMELPEAIEASRIHHQWFPDRLYLERRDEPAFQELVKQLRDRGHVVGLRSSQGSAHSIQVHLSKGLIQGVADYRRGGAAAGVE